MGFKVTNYTFPGHPNCGQNFAYKFAGSTWSVRPQESSSNGQSPNLEGKRSRYMFNENTDPSSLDAPTIAFLMQAYEKGWTKSNLEDETTDPEHFLGSKHIAINGNEAEMHEFPWIVSIQSNQPGFLPSHFCGASIISPTLLLTASHCFLSSPTRMNITFLVLGAHDITIRENLNLPIESVIIHPDYDSFFIQNDIALIKLRNSIQFDEKIQPVCLPSRQSSFTNQRAAVAGWGMIQKNSKYTESRLRKLNTRFLSYETCREHWIQTKFNTNMLCANSGTCNGDSGGPISVEQNGKAVLAGVVSYGLLRGCGYVPDVYTNVASYLGWLNYAAS